MTPKLCIYAGGFGEANINWKGGRCKHSNGYIMILAKDHPDADHHGYVMEHRLVMEQYLGRPLTKIEVVHHINGIKTDNRIENLQLLTRSEHIRLHAEEFRNKIVSKRECIICKSTKTVFKKEGYFFWHMMDKDRNMAVCHKCHVRAMWRIQK